MFNMTARALDFEYGFTTTRSIRENLTQPWVLDEDALLTNQIGHPYQGGLYFTAARSSGLGFWTSALYTTLGSAAWEYAWETEIPSINDQLTTSVGGVLLGEVMHRLSKAVLHGGGAHPGVWRWSAALLLDPMAFFNERALGLEPQPTQRVHTFASLGASYGYFATRDVEGRTERSLSNHIQLSGLVRHGLPGDLDYTPRQPLDHFELEFDLLASPDQLLGSLSTRGLLWGRARQGARHRRIAGLFVSQDYINRDRVRMGSVATGFGISSQINLGKSARWFLLLDGMLGVVPMGAAGRRDTQGSLPEDEQRDYQLGPGSTQQFDVRLGRHETFFLALRSHTTEIFALPLQNISDVTTVTSLGAHANLWEHHALGVEVDFFGSRRHNTQEDAMREFDTDRSVQALLTYTWVSDRGFGAVRTPLTP